MALSNILNEPQREITETVVGALLIAGFIAGDYYLSQWTQNLAGGWKEYPWPAGMILNGLGMIIGSLLLLIIPFAIHALGEAMCNGLQSVGIHLRPKRKRA